MGNQNAKSADKYSILSKDEIPIVSGSFKSVSNKHGDKVKEEDLMVSRSTSHKNQIQLIMNFFSEILGLTNGSTISSIHNTFLIW